MIDFCAGAATTSRLMSAETTSSVAPGQRVSLRIHDIAFGGEGVGRHGEMVVFVPFTALGEEVEVEFTEVKKNFARAKLVRIITASPDRVTPLCPHFGGCGGCQYQHLAYPAQVEMKRKQVADLFQRVGKLDPALVRPAVPCPQPYHYRNRIMIRSQWNKPEQKLNIGYLRWDCGLVEDIRECAIAEQALNEQIRHVRANPPPKGGIKVVLRIAPEDWDVPRDSFFQNNFPLLPRLVETARECLRDGGARFLVDVYCGVGFFGISLGDAVERFVGVELDRPAIKAARNNLLRHKRMNGEFIEGDAMEVLPELVQRFPAGETAVLLDPPRAGVPKAALEQLRAVRPRQVIYVSCHPATLARDLNALCADGVFTVRSMTPLDMFPQTQHVECVADVRLAQSDLANEGADGVNSAHPSANGTN
jgi:tRNA/tmRNA/rRNA uracil-C5-methylase (TrmA/RlmC/RlmD family)